MVYFFAILIIKINCMQKNLKTIVLVSLSLIPFLAWLVSDGRFLDLNIDFGNSGLFFPFISGKNFGFRVLVEIAFVAWAFLAIRFPEYRPRMSKLLLAYSIFIGVLFVADLFGVDPERSFLSNYERMEGFVTHLHLYLYFIMFTSVVRTAVEWDRMLKIFLSSNAVVLLWGYFQLLGSPSFIVAKIAPPLAKAFSGKFPIHMSGDRLDSTIGNSAYFAIYTALFAFIAAILYLREQKKSWRKVYVAMVVLNLIALFYTGTRGTQLGLGLGLLVAVCAFVFSYAKHKKIVTLISVLPVLGIVSALFDKNLLNFLYQGATLYVIIVAACAVYVARADHDKEKKIAANILVFIAACALIFTLAKGSDFVKNSPSLSRLANISVTDGTTLSRFTIWKMSYEGWKERPLLGYGQDNFGYIFARHFDPAMYGQEPWFDRSHNVFFDWLVAGGILGLLSYLSLFAIALYLLLKVKGDLSPKEKVLLLGALVTYFIHNTLVFDNLTSYILFFMLLAFISMRTEGHLHKPVHKNMSEYQAVLEPVAVVLTLIVFWFAVYKPYVANTLLIKAIDTARLAQGPQGNRSIEEVINIQIDSFKQALAMDSFGSQEVREQMVSYAARLAGYNASLPPVQKFLGETDKVIAGLSDKDKSDVRQLSIYGAYFNAKQDFTNAEAFLSKAHELSPNKQLIAFDLISTYIGEKKYADMYTVALQTYNARPQVAAAATILAAASVYAGKEAETVKIFTDNNQKFPLSIEVINAYINLGNYQRAIDLLNQYKAQNPGDATQVDAFIKQIIDRANKK